MSKAEKRACQYTGYCRNQSYSDFLNGYHQAEKDLALTWEDICEIMEIREEVLELEFCEDIYGEILKRFLERFKFNKKTNEIMENYNWIKAVAISNGKQVEVRQGEAGGCLWLDKEGTMYNFVDLDFTQAPELPDFMKSFEESNKRYSEQQEEYQKELGKILSSMDANAIADHKAKIDEREYWRKLRGDIFMQVYKSANMSDVLEWTKNYFDALYNQDKDFFKDK